MVKKTLVFWELGYQLFIRSSGLTDAVIQRFGSLIARIEFMLSG